MLSVIVVVYNMQREAPRTLHTLSSRYQRGVSENDYEVIVIDNGSSDRLTEDQVSAFGSNFHYVVCGKDATPSPCKAINAAVRRTRGDQVGVLIDGARMASPGLIRYAIDALRINQACVVTALSWHLGPKPQSLSIQEGYCQYQEDQLLDSIDWANNGYRLFDISSFAWSSACGYFGDIAESNAIFLSRPFYDALQGFEERFNLPGGGLANLDFYKRACEYPCSNVVRLLGEGTFHQIHGGISTNATSHDYGVAAAQEYCDIRGMAFSPPKSLTSLFGRPTKESFPWIERSLKLCGM
jgi:glycosyltransferase involved in cell wall biosynthesis